MNVLLLALTYAFCCLIKWISPEKIIGNKFRNSVSLNIFTFWCIKFAIILEMGFDYLRIFYFGKSSQAFLDYLLFLEFLKIKKKKHSLEFQIWKKNHVLENNIDVNTTAETAEKLGEN